MRFSILTSDKYDDTEYAELRSRDFIYNSKEPSCLLLTQSLRYQSTLDALGLEKCCWTEEVYKKFNVLSLVNFVFREYLATFLASEEELLAVANEAKEKADPLSKPTKRAMARRKSLSPFRRRSTLRMYGQASTGTRTHLSKLELSQLRDQYSMKSQQKGFDVQFVDNLLVKSRIIPQFRTLKPAIRHKLFSQAQHKEIKEYTELNLDVSAGSESRVDDFLKRQESIYLILSGTFEILVRKEKSGWQPFQVLGVGAAVPIISIHKLSKLYKAQVKVKVSGDCHLLVFS